MELFLRILACVAVSLGSATRFIRRTGSILDWRASGLGPEKADAPSDGEETAKKSLAETHDVPEI